MDELTHGTTNTANCGADVVSIRVTVECDLAANLGLAWPVLRACHARRAVVLSGARDCSRQSARGHGDVKCSHCGHNSRYRERSSTGQCPSCSKVFAFEKGAGYSLTDLSFKNAIDQVSDQQRVRWTLDHLYYDVCRAYYRRNLLLRIGKLVSKTVPMDRWRFTNMWERWRQVNGLPEGLIVDPTW
jgi:hypothetical protein